jgi:hypothetical protein
MPGSFGIIPVLEPKEPGLADFRSLADFGSLASQFRKTKLSQHQVKGP